MANFNVRLVTTMVEQGLKKFENKGLAAVDAYAETAAKKLETYAKTHKKWQNQTGRAHQTLVGGTERLTNGIAVTIAHGVWYGIWLELANEENYAILMPTIDACKDEIYRGLDGLFSRMRFN